MRDLDLDELAEFDGKDGKSAFIAHGSKIYDVSGSKLWKGGSHMRRHRAGADLTTDIQAAPHGPEVLERYPRAGTLKTAVSAEAPLPKVVERLMERFPMLRRHPHPMTVHFPIAFMMAVPLFTLLSLLTGSHSLEQTALHCLGAGLLFLPVVILTGLISWWVNYLGKPLMAVYVKAILSSFLFVFAVVAFTWRMAEPDVLHSSGTGGLLYLLLLLSFIPLVSVIGWYGAKLTFPVEHE
jgi:predicted heme/steroid binding protein/uncharacterized membrane protein